MQKRFSSWLALSVGGSDTVRQQYLLNMVLLGLAASGFLFGLVMAVLWALGRAPVLGMLAGLGVQPFYLLAYWLGRRGRVRLAAYVAATISFLVMVAVNYQLGLGHAVLIGYAIVTLAAGILIGTGAALLFTLLSIGAHLFIGAAQAAGSLLNPLSPDTTAVADGIALGLGLVVLVALNWLSSRELGGTLSRERELSAELRVRQAEWERPVIERTAELARANEQLRDEIAERERAEHENEERRRYLEGLLAAAPDAIVTLDARHRIVEWNPGAERLFGYSAEETIGRDIDDLVTGPDVFEEAIGFTRSVLSRKHVGPAETVRYRSDGSPVHVIVAGSPIVIRDELIGVVAVYTDITERVRAEEGQRKALAEALQATQALRESEERYRRLVETSPDAITVTDLRGKLIMANQRNAELHGCESVEELLDRDAFEFIAPEDRQRAMENARRTLETGSIRNVEYEMLRKDGSRYSAELSASLITDADGEPAAFIGVVRDITQRKQVEEALRRRAEELDVLQAIVLDITAAHDLPTLLQTIVERAALLLGAPGGGLYLCDAVREEARCVVSYNTPRDYTGTVLKYGDGAAGTVAQTGEPLIIDDYRAWSRRAPVYEEEQPFTAVLSVPMIWKGQVTGVIHVLRDVKGGCFTQTELELLTLFANHAAIAVENARLREQTQREITERRQAEETLRQRTAQLEALREVGLELTAQLDLDVLLRSVVSRAVELLGGTEGGLYLYRQEQDVLEWAVATDGARPPIGTVLRRGEGLSGRIRETGEPLIVDDYQHWEGRASVYEGYPFGSVVGVPVRWGPAGADAELLGVLIVSTDLVGVFSPADAELLSLLATRAAIAIRNTRLYEEAKRRALEQQMLREAALALTTTLDRNEVIDRILAQLQEVVPYDTASVQLLRTGPKQGQEDSSAPGRRGDYLEIVGERGFPNPEQILGITFDPSREDNPNREVVHTRASFIVADAPTVYEEFTRDPHAPAGIRSWLGVPMLVGERLIGMIALDKIEAGFYTEQHARLAEAFAAQAAIAVENSRLFQSEREQRELTEALEKAAAAVSSTLELDQVLDRILEQVERVVTGDAFNVMMIEGDIARAVRWLTRGRVERRYRQFAARVAKYPNLVRMVESGEPVVVSDSAIDPDWVVEEGWEWVRSYVGAPVQVTGSTVGFLSVYGTRAGQFGAADARRLQAFAGHAAAAIENARLYQQLRDHAELLEQRVKERTAELYAQYARLDAILRSTADGIVVTGVEGEILQTNLVAQRWLTQTLSPEEASRLQDAVRRVAARADEHPVDLIEMTGLDLELSGAPILEPMTGESPQLGSSEPGLSARGEPAAVVVVHDASHLKALERMKTRFVTNISHELRTPITTIKLYIHLMQRQPDKREEYLDVLAQEADHQAALVQDILQISHIDAGRLEMAPRPTSINELTETIVVSHRVLAQRRGLVLKHNPEEPGPIALVDPKRMTQVLNNLVENAIRYTPSGGTVTVSTGTREAERRTWATAVVADTGIGIPAAELPHVFDRFFRGEEPRTMQVSGTGLGLAIVKEIVELHGGRVAVESEVGVGSAFTVWLPLGERVYSEEGKL